MAESMTPLVLVALALTADAVRDSRWLTRTLLIAGVVFEFLISRGLYLVLIASGQPLGEWSPTDAANLVLKSAENLVFARDSLDSGTIAFASVMLFAALGSMILVALVTAGIAPRRLSLPLFAPRRELV